MEIWKDIKGYEGKYQVSSEGRIWSIGRQKVLKPQTDRHGYKHVTLIAKNGKKVTELIHRLVALTFLPNEDNLPQVDHINEDKSDNRVCNLRWVTAKENTNHGTRNERIGKNQPTKRKIHNITTNIIYDSIAEAQRDTGVPHQNIVKVCQGTRKTAGGFEWEYINN